MIGIVVGADSWTENTIPERQTNVVHAPAGLWLGPLCNLGYPPGQKLITGAEVAAEAVTCWRCSHPQEAIEMEAEWAAKWERWEKRGIS